MVHGNLVQCYFFKSVDNIKEMPTFVCKDTHTRTTAYRKVLKRFIKRYREGMYIYVETT